VADGARFFASLALDFRHTASRDVNTGDFKAIRVVIYTPRANDTARTVTPEAAGCFSDRVRHRVTLGSFRHLRIGFLHLPTNKLTDESFVRNVVNHRNYNCTCNISLRLFSHKTLHTDRLRLRQLASAVSKLQTEGQE